MDAETSTDLSRRRLLGLAAAGAGVSVATPLLTPPAAAAPQRAETVPPPTGDATTDTANLQTALNGGGAVVLAPGTYVQNATLTVPSDTLLEGSGAGVTIVQAAPGFGDVPQIQNADISGGNAQITITALTVDGNKAGQNSDGAKHGIFLQRVSDGFIDNVECRDVDGHGIRVDGHGVITRNFRFANVHVHDNRGIGLYATWAMRNVEYVNVLASANGSHGVEFDHSEAKVVNIDARGNGGSGIFIRNVFGCIYSNLHATRNGQHGILVQGMTDSSGMNWFAANNSSSSVGAYDDVYFSGDATLSFGITNQAVIIGLAAGPNAQFGATTEAYGLYVADPSTGSIGDLKIFGALVGAGTAGSFRQPSASGGLVIIDFPTTTANLRWWIGNGLATPNGFQLGTSPSHRIGFLGATPVGRQAGGAATAGAAYSATEQQMLQSVYDCLRTFGLLT
jgi:hypothetical protein